LDAARPDAVERRRATAQRTARENIDDLCDPGSFVEYGPLVIAAQRRRRPVEELIERTPADGLVAGIGRVNGQLFDESRSRCVVIIATANSSIGMGGPAMIEGGGLGVFHPDEVGPMHVQVPGGVVDVAVADEVEAVRAAKQYLGYFQGPLGQWECADQRLLRG